MVYLKLFVIVFGAAYCYPSSWVQKIAENQQFNENDNIIKKYDDEFSDLEKYFSQNVTGGPKAENYTKSIIPFTTVFSNVTDTSNSNATTTTTTSTNSNTTFSTEIDPVAAENKTNKNRYSNETRNTREEVDDLNKKASQEADSSEEDEEGGNMITGLLGAFLGGLSKPDGSIDLEAILGLLGSLSTQNPDGTYDFDGLTQLLRSFFGAGPDGGGSDIGAFAGGLLGALIKGVANPPGPKGAGILAGKVVTGILPALSAPEPPMDSNGTNPWRKEPQLDSGSFLTGFIRTALGSNGNGMGEKGGSKYTLFKLIFSAITGVISAASSLSSKSDWQT